MAAASPDPFAGLARVITATKATAKAALARGARALALGASNGNSLLGDPDLYRRQIERLHNKYLFTPQFYDLQQEGVPFASISRDAGKFAKLIAREIGRGEFQFEPGEVRQIHTAGKTREVFSFGLTDLIVHRAISALIEGAMHPVLSPQLYSYRTGVSWIAPASDFSAYVRAHVKSHPDPRDRGIFVLRRDIESYTDTIPVGANSRVWPMIRAVLDSAGTKAITPYEWSLIENVVRPVVSARDGGLYSLSGGIPTGQPIGPVLYNLYLAEFDHEFDQIPGAFYGRYSDDMLFAHTELSVVKQAGRRIEDLLSGLDLRLNPAKSQNLYLTAAGRRPTDWERGRGTSSIPYVGTNISAQGTVGLNRKKLRVLLRDIERRVRHTVDALQDREPAHAGPIVCSVVNRVLRSHATIGRGRSAPLVRRVVTDRAQLAQLDYWIARIVLKAVVGPGVRAFRRVSYRTVREDWGLMSLLYARNRWGK